MYVYLVARNHYIVTTVNQLGSEMEADFLVAAKFLVGKRQVLGRLDGLESATPSHDGIRTLKAFPTQCLLNGHELSIVVIHQSIEKKGTVAIFTHPFWSNQAWYFATL